MGSIRPPGRWRDWRQRVPWVVEMRRPCELCSRMVPGAVLLSRARGMAEPILMGVSAILKKAPGQGVRARMRASRVVAGVFQFSQPSSLVILRV